MLCPFRYLPSIPLDFSRAGSCALFLECDIYGICREGNGQLCRMQDKVVAEQMLQTPGFEWDDLLYVINPVVGVTEVISIDNFHFPLTPEVQSM